MEIIQGIGFLLAGIVIDTFAKQISDREKHIAQAHNWTRMTGWSGTRRGIVVWRAIGVAITLGGLLTLLLRFRSWN